MIREHDTRLPSFTFRQAKALSTFLGPLYVSKESKNNDNSREQQILLKWEYVYTLNYRFPGKSLDLTFKKESGLEKRVLTPSRFYGNLGSTENRRVKGENKVNK